MPNKFISYITIFFVATLALIAFILSYNSLQHLAAQNGIPGWLSYLWPLLLDFAMVIFSLAILRANLLRERAVYPWTLTIAFAGLATLANILDVTSLGLPPVIVAASVKGLAPVALVLAFELLMGMLKNDLTRHNTIATLDQLKTQTSEQQTTLADLHQTIETLTTKREQVAAELAELRKDKKNLKRNFNQIGDDTRTQAYKILAERYAENAKPTGAELGRLVGRSSTTGRNLLNELWPQIATNGNGTEAH